MPRHNRLNLPGCIYHVITRGLESKNIFTDKYDCNEFISRLSLCLKETGCQCLGWALIPNHFHLLIRTGKDSLTSLMRKLLTGYAIYFNKRHARHGYLYQNRYKSILCQEDTYLLELIRYVHLNPLRAQLVKDLDHLDRYPWTGHSAIMGYQKREWQEIDYVLVRFGEKTGESRKIYREFIKEGIGTEKREDLLSGGLRRNAKAWNSMNSSKRSKESLRGDERILGNKNFVDTVLKAYEEDLDYREELKQKGWNLERLVEEICNRLKVNPEDITMKGRNNKLSIARQLISYFGYHELGISGSELSSYLKMTRPSLSANIKKAKRYIEENGVKLIN